MLIAEEDHGSTESSRPRRWKFLVVALFLFAAGLRWACLDTQSFSMDECLEVSTAKSSVREIVRLSNSFPPLYHLALKCWMLVERSELSVRTFSLFVGMISIWAFWRLVVESFPDEESLPTKAGLLSTSTTALLLAALSPFHIFYSVQGRGYGLFILFGVLTVHCGLRLQREPTQRDIGTFVLLGVLGSYTHYYFPIVLLSIGLGILGTRGIRYFLRTVMPLAVAIAVLVTPLLFLLPGDLEYQRDLRANRPPSLSAVGYTFFSFESGYSLGPSRAELHTMSSSAAIQSALPWAIGLSLLVGIAWICGTARVFELRELPFWLSTLGTPVIVIVLLCLTTGVTYNTRFLVCCWIPHCLLVAAGTRVLPPLFRYGALIGIICIYAVAIGNRNFQERYMNEDVRAAAEFIDSECQKRDSPIPVFVCAGYMAKPLRRYIHSETQVTRLMDCSFSEGSESQALERLRGQTTPFWFVYARQFHGDPRSVIRNRLSKSTSLNLSFQSAGVEVLHCEGFAN